MPLEATYTIWFLQHIVATTHFPLGRLYFGQTVKVKKRARPLSFLSHKLWQARALLPGISICLSNLGVSEQNRTIRPLIENFRHFSALVTEI